MTRSPDRASSLRGPGAIAVAIGVASISTYLFTMVAARLLGPEAYGALTALMNTLMVATVLQLGLQATAARRISAHPDHVTEIERQILRVTRLAALALGVLLLVATPLLDRLLKLDSLPTTALVAVSVVPLTLMGGQAGILQGERRWAPLGLLYLAFGVPRLVIGTAFALWHPSAGGAMLGVTIGCFVPAVVGWWALRRPREVVTHSRQHSVRALMRETVRSSQALLAFFALSNVDIVIARNVLDSRDAGLYAGGLILTKAVLFLPQFVVVVAFPSMSTAHERRQALLRSTSAIAVLGVVVVIGVAVLAPVAMLFVGGHKYEPIESKLWIFAVVGTALSMLQLLVYSVLARQGARSIYLVWAGLVVLVALGATTSTLTGLLTVVAVTDLALFAVLMVLSLVLLGREQPAVAAGEQPGT